jgi:pimeloyl-ACP methyl ester carboxylesterase
MPDLNLSPGLTIHYLEFNSDARETVLLLHGLGASSESWALQLPALTEKGYRVLAPDARAFGH